MVLTRSMSINVATQDGASSNSEVIIDIVNQSSINANNLHTAKMSISLELAEKILIKFDRFNSILHEFIDNCDQAYNLVSDINKPILFSIIKTKLTHNARSLTQNQIFETWQQLRQHLFDLYSDKRTIGQWQLELNSCRQNFNESVASFSTCVESCYIKLINSLEDNMTKKVCKGCIQL